MNSDRLLFDVIKKNLRTKIIGREIITFECTTSTMDIAKQMLDKSVKEGTAIFAEQQTKGRGRSGKMWFCPKSKGLLLTIILRPAIPPEKSYFLIGFSAVAAVKTIRDMFKLPVEIDWPNDLVINKKKLGGIVIETQNETGKNVNYILGIGINVNLNKQELPMHVNKPVTSLAIEKETFIDRNKLAMALLQNLDSWYLILKEERYEYIVEKWQELCANIGRKMIIKENSLEYAGSLIGISDNGELMLLLDNGHKRTFRIEHTIVKHN
jgi:BirA family transcriptional regulator, biotin operon repressor / biotin---[acetyl-CoA-carboxylase] ligase